MARLVSENWCNALGFIGLGDDQPIIEEQIEKVSEAGNQSYGAPDTMSTRSETTQKDRSLIMNPHPKVNPKIENSLSSLWALTLTFFKIWMSRLDKPAGTSLWSDKPLSANRGYEPQGIRAYYPSLLFPIFIHKGLVNRVWRCVAGDVLVEESCAGLCYEHGGHGCC